MVYESYDRPPDVDRIADSRGQHIPNKILNMESRADPSWRSHAPAMLRPSSVLARLAPSPHIVPYYG